MEGIISEAPAFMYRHLDRWRYMKSGANGTLRTFRSMSVPLHGCPSGPCQFRCMVIHALSPSPLSPRSSGVLRQSSYSSELPVSLKTLMFLTPLRLSSSLNRICGSYQVQTPVDTSTIGGKNAWTSWKNSTWTGNRRMAVCAIYRPKCLHAFNGIASASKPNETVRFTMFHTAHQGMP